MRFETEASRDPYLDPPDHEVAKRKIALQLECRMDGGVAFDFVA